jgi:hypothetical protein
MLNGVLKLTKLNPSTLFLSLRPAVFIYGTQIRIFSIIKYLRLTIDRRLTWAPHLKSKIVNLNIKKLIIKNELFYFFFQYQ